MKSNLARITALVCLAGSSTAAYSQCAAAGADIVSGDINLVTNFATDNGVDAISLGFIACNSGDAPIIVQASQARHPVMVANLYRVSNSDGATRIEQIGMSWTFHFFFALATNFCCSDCPGGNGAVMNPNCSSPESSSYTGNPQVLGPRFEVNPSTVTFPFPFTSPPIDVPHARRLRFDPADVNPALNAGSTYFVETLLLAAEDSASGQNANNASHRRVVFTSNGDTFNATYSGSTVRSAAAIESWHAADAAVVVQPVSIAGDGRMIVAGRATQLPSGLYRYEYAVENLDSHRAARSFSVPIAPGTQVTNIGFHDVDYHSHDGLNNVTVDGADWSSSVGTSVEWSTQTFAENENANALRWGTLYNFRFECNAPPAEGTPEIGLFRPGVPASVLTGTLPVPGVPTCAADFDHDGFITGADFDLYVQAFEAGETTADFDLDGFITGADYDAFVQAYEAGC